jgi:hypothetical protein
MPSQDILDTVAKRIYDELLSVAPFLRTGPGDENRYYLGLEALHELTWSLLNIALPIATSISSAIITEIIKQKIHKASPATIESAEALKEIASSLGNLTVMTSDGERAEAAIKEMLLDRGLTTRDATRKASAIVKLLCEKVTET